MNEPGGEHICKSCGNAFHGYYCNICGEKVIIPQDRSFKAFLNSLLQALTLADGKVLRTISFILRKPGFISSEMSTGRRVRYLKPISLFFALNLIYFIFPVIQLFNASLNTQLRGPLGRFIIGPLVTHSMIATGIHDLVSFSLIYDQKTATLAKLIVMVFVILAALPLIALHRKNRFYFTDHMGFALELVCFNLFLNAIFLTIVLKVFGAGRFVDDTILTGIFVSTNLYFLFRGGHEFYQEHGWKLVAKSVIMLFLLKVALDIYRLILFLLTIWTM